MATADVRTERHPDTVALRAHYDEAAENPLAQAADGVAFTIPVLGLWMIVAPWVVVGVTTTTPMIWSNVLGGAAVLAFSLTVMALGMMRRHN